MDVFTRKECKDIIIRSLDFCIQKKGLVINAFVLMSNHLHLIARAEEDSQGLSNIIRDFKRHTSKEIINWVLDDKKESRKKWMEIVMKYHAKFNKNNNDYQLWIQNNKPMECNKPRFTWQKISYIHDNPIKAKIVDHPEDYIYSSARNYLGRKDVVLDIVCLDLDINIGYVDVQS